MTTATRSTSIGKSAGAFSLCDSRVCCNRPYEDRNFLISFLSYLRRDPPTQPRVAQSSGLQYAVRRPEFLNFFSFLPSAMTLPRTGVARSSGLQYAVRRPEFLNFFSFLPSAETLPRTSFEGGTGRPEFLNFFSFLPSAETLPRTSRPIIRVAICRTKTGIS